jgi:hypothetical protein
MAIIRTQLKKSSETCLLSFPIGSETLQDVALEIVLTQNKSRRSRATKNKATTRCNAK